MLIEIIKNIFGSLDDAKQKETFSSYKIEFLYKGSNKLSQNLNEEAFNLINKTLSEYNYKWDLYIENLNYSLSQDSFTKLNIDTEELECEVVFTIHKGGNKILIVDETLFFDFISKIDLETILQIFNKKQFPLSFINDNFDLTIGTEYEQEKAFTLSKQCNFRNYSQYAFSPDFFYIKDEKTQSILTDFIDSISLVYCLIYIFDSTEIAKNKIELSISGFKTIKYILDFKAIDKSLLNHYYTIYKWIYTETNNTEDKIGISRNILTSYLKEGSIKINDSVFNSILSSNQIYVKGNISKYFEVKNKIVQQIEQTINDVNKSLDTFLTNFQKSSFVFLSFFLSVFIFKVIKKSDLTKIFTKETTLIGIGFIIISFLYLITSLIIIHLEKNRLDVRYKNVKKRYEDVLFKEDIKKILNNNSEFNDEIRHLEKRVKIYTIVWILSLVIFYLVLHYTSDFLNLSK
jgi:hypothetical protein